MTVAMPAAGRRPRSGPAPERLADAVASMLRLARGVPARPADADVDWARVYAVALRERCDVLCWARGGELIRRGAPDAVQGAWRRGVLVDQELRRRQVDAMLELVSALERAGCDPVVLKGAPLSQRLYGDPLLRPTSDVDLYVPPARRASALDALRDLGWRHRHGSPPWEEVFERGDGPWQLHCELHYSLRDDALAHIPLPPPAATHMVINGVITSVFGGALVPAYLAAHLVKHQLPPLLWRIDFATLWDGLNDTERREARSAARSVRLHRYLAWAVRDAMRLDAATAGNLDALRALGFAHETRRDMHAMVRAVALAATPADAGRVLAAWAWPHDLRRDRRGMLERLRERLSTPLDRVAVKRASYAPAVASDPAGSDTPGAAARALDVPPHELVELVRDVVGRGGSLWVRARGCSMEPTVPSGAMVRVRPLDTGAPRRGDVVLARLPTGVPAVHRVVFRRGATVRLRGDAQFADDPPITVADVLGVVDRVAVGGQSVPIADRGHPPLLRSIAGAGRRLRMRLRQRLGRTRTA